MVLSSYLGASADAERARKYSRTPKQENRLLQSVKLILDYIIVLPCGPLSSCLSSFSLNHSQDNWTELALTWMPYWSKGGCKGWFSVCVFWQYASNWLIGQCHWCWSDGRKEIGQCGWAKSSMGCGWEASLCGGSLHIEEEEAGQSCMAAINCSCFPWLLACVGGMVLPACLIVLAEVAS